MEKQTVYIQTKNKSDFGVIDPSFGESNSYVKTGYFLSEEELRELLSNTWQASMTYNHELDISDSYSGKPIKSQTKEQYINSIVK